MRLFLRAPLPGPGYASITICETSLEVLEVVISVADAENMNNRKAEEIRNFIFTTI